MDSSPVIRPKLDLVIIDCPNALVLARFYAEVLGWEIEDGADENVADLVPPGGRAGSTNPDGRTTLSFTKIDDHVAPTWPGGEHPQRFHLDLSVPDLDAAEPLVLAAGARKHELQPAEDGHFRVYLDPAGHPFCLIVGQAGPVRSLGDATVTGSP